MAKTKNKRERWPKAKDGRGLVSVLVYVSGGVVQGARALYDSDTTDFRFQVYDMDDKQEEGLTRKQTDAAHAAHVRHYPIAVY